MKSTLLIAVIIDFAFPAQREKEEELQFVCVKRWRKKSRVGDIILPRRDETQYSPCARVCV